MTTDKPKSSYWLIDRFLLALITKCLEDGQIKETDDLKIIKEILFSDNIYTAFIDGVSISVSHIDSLEDSIKLEVQNHNYFQAILLAVTCVEHLLNEFYGRYYECCCNLSNSKINSILKANGISEKVAGLFEITFNEPFPQNLEQQINQMKRKRNEYTHYKPTRILLDDLDNTSYKDEEIKSIALSAISVIEQLKDFITNMETKLYPQDAVAKKILIRIKSEGVHEQK